MAKIRVNIYDKAYVPSLGRGPFMNKFIHEELFRSLKRLGYVVEKADENVSDRLIFETSNLDEGFLIDGEADETEAPADVETTEAPKVETTEAPADVETTEAPADVETTEAPKVELTDEEVKFLTGKAKRQEIIDLLTEKGVHIENEDATIAELLDLVGLTR